MGLVRLLGFSTLSCGCVVGRYLELAGEREVAYVEEKGDACPDQAHRRNHAVSERRGRCAAAAPFGAEVRAS
jgi:hypothetical protein